MDPLVTRAEAAPVLRALRAEDIGSLNAIYRPYAGRDIATNRVEEALSLYPSVAALQAGRIVGFCYCFRFAPDIIELANIFVSKAYRKDGLGSMMLSYLLGQIHDPVQAVIAVNSALNEVRESKSSPDSFYLRNGFTILATTESSTIYWWRRLEAGG